MTRKLYKNTLVGDRGRRLQGQSASRDKQKPIKKDGQQDVQEHGTAELAHTAPVESQSSHQLSKTELRNLFSKELQQLEEVAKKEGFKQGVAEFDDLVAEEVEKTQQALLSKYQQKIDEANRLIAVVNAAAIEFKNHADIKKSELESHVLALCLESLYALFGSEDVGRHALEQLVAKAIENTELTLPARLYVAKQDKDLIENSAMLEASGLQITVDTQLERGKCYLQSGPTLLEIDLIEQLDELRANLVDLYRDRTLN